MLFRTHYHPKLNGKFSMTMQATELTYDLQPFPCDQDGNYLFPNTPNQMPLQPSLMLQLTIHGIHSTIGWHLTLQTSILAELQSSRIKGQSCFGSVDGCLRWRVVVMESYHGLLQRKCMPLLMQFRRVMLCGKTISFKYKRTSPKKNPPKMDAQKTYELCTHDSHLLLTKTNSFSTTSFADQINYAPYWSISGQWETIYGQT